MHLFTKSWRARSERDKESQVRFQTEAERRKITDQFSLGKQSSRRVVSGHHDLNQATSRSFRSTVCKKEKEKKKRKEDKLQHVAGLELLIVQQSVHLIPSRHLMELGLSRFGSEEVKKERVVVRLDVVVLGGDTVDLPFDLVPVIV